MHITARTLDAARALLGTSFQAGLRNSGISISSKGRFTIGIRSAPAGLNVPIAQANVSGDAYKLLVSPEYLVRLLHIAQAQMADNAMRIERLTEAVRAMLQSKSNGSEWEPADERRERKKREGLARQTRAKKPPSDSLLTADVQPLSTDLDG